ncbi:MAG: glycosyltransferase family 2 protein [Candidatus Bathyarchaeota archaeon]|nr:glycosyltransferase family 2 protein [Candidatus Termiticorpusculum sp.]
MYVYCLVTYSFHWLYVVLMFYGVLVTPYLALGLVHAHQYRPEADKGYRPTVSIIMPCYNEGAAIADAISAVLSLDYPKDKMELVVVDDGSTDNTPSVVAELLEKSNGAFRFLRMEKNMKKRHAMAYGIEHAIGELIVSIDSDAIVESSALVNLVQPFTDPDVYCVSGNAIVSNEYKQKSNTFLARLQKVWYTDGFCIRKGAESLFGIVLCCSGVLSAFRKDKVRQILPNWLTETFRGRKCLSGEDAQLTTWMLKLGGKSVFQSNAIVYTEAPVTMKAFIKQQLRWGRGSFYSMMAAFKIFLKKSAVAKLFFYSTFITSVFSPVVLFLSLLALMMVNGVSPLFVFIAGYLLVGYVSALTCKMLVPYFTNKDLFYRTILFILMIPLSILYFYSWITIYREKTWGTR